MDDYEQRLRENQAREWFVTILVFVALFLLFGFWAVGLLVDKLLSGAIIAL